MEKSLYHSERGLWEFQAEHAALSYFMPTTLANWDTGTGKGHLAMALSALRLEDGSIDHVLLVCEKNKMVADEWPKDLDHYTDIDWLPYAGPPKRRAKIRENLPQLLLASYDIIKNDAAVFIKDSRADPTPGPLIDALEGKRIFLIYDETTRIANRTSKTHKAHALLVRSLRLTEGFRLLAMTATPMEKDPQNYYNLARILVPEAAPTVHTFERQYVSMFDVYRNPFRFKNVKESEEPGVPPLKDLMAPITLRKRKSDPDVVEFFPKRREMAPNMIELDPLQQHFYNTVESLTDGLSPWEQRQFSTILRQIANHPASLINSEGEIVRSIVEAVTPEGLRRIPSTKTNKMLDWCQTVVKDQGAKCVIFTYYAHSVLPLLREALEAQDYLVAVNHGGLSTAARTEAQRFFRQGEAQIFLTSDAGQKGINLPEATYLLHYERPTTHANFIQRSDRIHRIDSLAESVFIYSFVAMHTLEEGLFNLGLRRNEWNDKIQGDDEIVSDDFISAEDRKVLLRIGRSQKG